MTETELQSILAEREADRIETTVSATNTDKFAEAVCAFANDLPNHRKPGYLIIGVDDKQEIVGTNVDDKLLLTLAELRGRGTIQPLPSITVEKVAAGSGDVAVVTVQPSLLPPVRYKGRVCIRSGPRRDYATEQDEKILNEKRVSHAVTFDAQPALGSSLDELDLRIFQIEYQPQVIDAEVLAENHRPMRHQLASLRFFDIKNDCPTNAGILLFAQDVINRLPGAFLQFLRVDGLTLSDPIVQDHELSDDLLTLLRELDAVLSANMTYSPSAAGLLREDAVVEYPLIAIRELAMNAVMHRDYASTAPIRMTWFNDRIEIQSPGGLYGEASAANFPNQTSYRNPVVAEALKALGYVNRYGRGVIRARDAMAKNGNPPPNFLFEPNYVLATLQKVSMNVIAFFNSKSGVGRTTLLYHVAYMLVEQHERVLVVDLDPQANATSMFLPDDRLDEIWHEGEHPLTIYSAVRPAICGTGDVSASHVEEVADNLGLVAGDLGLSTFEDTLSQAWPQCLGGDDAAVRATTAFHKAIICAAREYDAAWILIDVGPNLGAINRAALIAAEHIIIPLNPDLLSLQALRTFGPALRRWRNEWVDRLKENPGDALLLPSGRITPLGYVLLQQGIRAGQPPKADHSWIDKLPDAYREFVIGESSEYRSGVKGNEDPHCLATIKHYRSLMPMAAQARKPVFELKPADGAIGAHGPAVRSAYTDFANLVEQIKVRINAAPRDGRTGQ